MVAYKKSFACRIEPIKKATLPGCGFLIIGENPTLDVGFKRAYSGEEDIKTYFDIIENAS